VRVAAADDEVGAAMISSMVLSEITLKHVFQAVDDFVLFPQHRCDAAAPRPAQIAPNIST
jgi:hypothetical protein